MSKEVQLPEAQHKFDKYYACPNCKDAVYHTYSFTHRLFICKDCNKEFKIPESISLNKPKPFKKKRKEVKSSS